MPGLVVSVLNMKGGVGKTTITAHVMREFYRRRKKNVLVIDLDPQFNLTQCVMGRAEYDKLKGNNKTIFQAMEPPSNVGLFDVKTTVHAPPKPADISHNLKHITGTSIKFDLLCGDFRLVKYSLIDDHNKLELVKTRFLTFISMARQIYDLVVIDCNPSSSFITLCALHACQSLLVPVRPDRYSILGLELLNDFVAQVPTIHPKPSFTVLLNGVKRSAAVSPVEVDLRKHSVFGPNVLVSKLYQSGLLAATSNYAGFATDKRVAHRKKIAADIAKVVDELATVWGL
jgi:chromosome partitioning protein